MVGRLGSFDSVLFDAYGSWSQSGSRFTRLREQIASEGKISRRHGGRFEHESM